MNTKKPILLLLFCCAAAKGQTPVSFGEALSGPVILSNGTILNAYIISGTTGKAGTDHGTTSDSSPSLGGIFGGTVFDGSVDPFYATRLEANPSQSVDNGVSSQRRDFVGFRLHFSQATEISSFYFVDIDGSSAVDSGEWAASFAYDGPTLLIPTLAVPNSGSNNVSITTPAINASWNTLVDNTLGTSVDDLPSIWTLGQQLFAGSPGNSEPDDSNSQMKVTYTSKLTDLFVMFGVRDDRSALQPSAFQNSGITGFTVTVPEPSISLLSVGAGLAWLGFRRKRREGQ